MSTKKDLTLNSVTTGDSVLNNNGLTIKDGPSITKDGINAGGKKITDVANGVIAQNSKDAVNGGQVHHISNSIKNSIGGNTVVNPDGSLTTNNIGGTGKNNINDAIKSVDEKVTNGVNDLTQKGLNFGANDQKTTQGKAVHRKLGDTINIVGGANPETAEDKTSGENIITRTTEDGVKIEMLKDVKFDSVNVGGHVLNQQGLTIKGGPSITVNGINAGGKQITNVADGINAKDAVNKGQLDKQINEVKDQIGKDIGKLSDHAVQYDKDKNGNVDKNSVTLGGGEKGTNLKNVADGKIAEGSKDAVNGGQLWNVQNQVDKNSNDIKNIQNNIDNISNGKAGLVQQQKPNGEITVGKDSGGTSINMAGKEGDRVVQGVKDGEIKAGSNQAVNGGQIHKISESIKNSIGGNTTIDPKDGSITTNNIGGTGKNNINDAISEVKNTAKKAKTTVTEGDNIVVKETVNKDGSTNYEVSTKKDLTLNSVTTGDSVLNNNGLTIKEGPSITKEGINAGGKKITNVADGINAKDAVNVDQLTKVKENLNGRITDTNNQLNDAKKDLGNQIADTNKNLNDAKKDLGDQITDTNTKLNNTKDQLTTQINDTKTELNNTIGNTKTELENKGLNFAGNSGSDVHRKLGDKLNIVGGAAASTPVAKTSGENVITRTTKDGIQIELLKDSKFDSVTTGNTTLNTNGLTIKEGPSITKDGINAGGKKITNVADGINAKDAVNKSQLDNLAAKQNATDDAAVKYDDAKTKDKVTLKGKDGTVLDNVKAGHISSTSKEAVNGSQIHNISNSIKNSIGGNTVVNPDGSLTTSNIGGTGKNNINDAISEVKNTAKKAKTTVTEGDNIVVKETVNKDGSTNYEVSTKKDLTLNSVTTGDSVLNNNGLTIKDGPSITKDGINAGGKKITDVANGVIAKI
ncbi:phage T7 tail fiber family protein [Acinetobacter baumannii 1032359]|nr:phage T7 tail fiber family protein [Acinetobacter baumannii 1032359]